MKEAKSNGSVIVSWDFSNGFDAGILLVGEQKHGRVEVINAFKGEEAYSLYKKLTTVGVKNEGAST